MSGTGLKKCSPPNRSGRLLDAAHDAQRRGVRQKIVAGPTGVERREHRRLLVHVLDDRLDHEVAAPEILEPGCPGEIRQRRVASVGRDLALLDAVVEELPDPPQTLLEEIVTHFADDRPVVGLRRDLRDAGTHEPASEHTDCFDGHSRS
jgi:hypothetical protein